MKFIKKSLCHLFFSLTAKNCNTKKVIPSNARASINKNGTVFFVVNITCVKGFQLVNARLTTRLCMASGEWTGNDMDFCEPVPCHDPINLPPRSAFVSGKEPRDPRFGTKVTVMCPTGFKNANGSGNVYCDSDGKWRWTSGHLSCERQTCSDPHTIQDGDGLKNVTRRMFQISTNVSFICMAGYELVGQASITCRENGRWSHPSPHCKWKKKERVTLIDQLWP